MALILSSVILIALVGVLYLVSFWASITNRSIEKLSAYECGLEPIGDARMKFDILYYVIGILYLIFDLEIIFLFPLATVLFSIGSLLAVWVVMIFLIILTIGFLYEWFHGALEIVLPVLVMSCFHWVGVTTPPIGISGLHPFIPPMIGPSIQSWPSFIGLLVVLACFQHILFGCICRYPPLAGYPVESVIFH